MKKYWLCCFLLEYDLQQLNIGVEEIERLKITKPHIFELEKFILFKTKKKNIKKVLDSYIKNGYKIQFLIKCPNNIIYRYMNRYIGEF